MNYEEFIQDLTNRYPNILTRWTNFYIMRKGFPELQDKSPPDEWKAEKATVETLSQMDRQPINLTAEEVKQIINPSFARFGDYAYIVQLMNASGRRISEIINTPFKIEDGLLHYIPKKKVRSTEYHPINFLIDMTPEQFMTLLNETRELFKTNNLNNITRQLNRRLKKINPELTTHSLRSIYTQRLVKVHNPSNITQFVAGVLNHDNTLSAHRYNFLKLEEDEKTEEPVEEPDIKPSEIPGKLMCLKCKSIFKDTPTAYRKHIQSKRHLRQ